MKTIRLLLFCVLSLFLSLSLNAQTCTPSDEITITNWTNSSIDVEWPAVTNATQYSIEIFDAASNTSIYFGLTTNSQYSLPGGLFNSLSEITIEINAECGGVWHPRAIEIYTIPDVWIVYGRLCPPEGEGALYPYKVRMNYPTPIYSSNYHLYDSDCFCTGVTDIEDNYNNNPTSQLYPISILADPHYLTIQASGRRPLRYTSDAKGYFNALWDYNELEIYFGFHCHGLEPEFEYDIDIYGKTSISEDKKALNKVYPNPASVGFTFENLDNRNVSVVVYNLIGIAVMEFEVTSESKSYITLPPVANGLLYLQLNYEGNDVSEIIPLNIIR